MSVDRTNGIWIKELHKTVLYYDILQYLEHKADQQQIQFIIVMLEDIRGVPWSISVEIASFVADTSHYFSL